MSIEILISTFNRVEFLKVAIKSVLEQEYSDFVLTVVNSGSTDETDEYLKSIDDVRLKTIRFDENLGISKNIERSMAQTTQRYVVLFHDDDVMESHLLNTYVKNLEEGVILYHSDVKFIDSHGVQLNRVRPVVEPLIEKNQYIDFLIKNRRAASIVMPTVMVDTGGLRDNSIWPLTLNPKLSMLVDMGIWIQLNEFGGFKYIDKKCLRYRLHNNSGTSVFGKKINEMFINRWAIFTEINLKDKGVLCKLLSVKYLLRAVMYDFKVLFFKKA